MFLNENATVLELWAHKSNCKKAKIINVPARDFNSLSLRLSGHVTFEAGQNSLVSKAGSVTFMPAGTGYSTEVCEAGQMLLVHFKTAAPTAAAPFCIDGGDIPELHGLFCELINSYQSGRERDYHCLSVLYSMLALIQKQLQYPEKKLIPKRMRLAKDFIDKNYNDELHISSLAYASGVSEVHFRNEFKRCFGYSPSAYIKKVRIDNAKLLLRSGYYSVSEVATSCGFDSISYFSYEFRRIVGVTPKEYIMYK